MKVSYLFGTENISVVKAVYLQLKILKSPQHPSWTSTSESPWICGTVNSFLEFQNTYGEIDKNWQSVKHSDEGNCITKSFLYQVVVD